MPMYAGMGPKFKVGELFDMTNTLLQKSNIFAHRGLWTRKSDQNTISSIEGALGLGYSVEVDIVAYGDDVLLSHDMRDLATKPKFQEIRQSGESSIALNLKCDDAWENLLPQRRNLEISRSFFFDGSGPTMKRIQDAGLPFANRVSDFEAPFELSSKTLWVDSYTDKHWINSSELARLAETHSRIVFVSPELHGHPYLEFWSKFLEWRNSLPDAEIGICTDHPVELFELSQGGI